MLSKLNQRDEVNINVTRHLIFSESCFSEDEKLYGYFGNKRYLVGEINTAMVFSCLFH